jgi:hypothetical protein
VDRRPHQRRLDDGAVLERPRQVFALEAGDPRPEADVPRWCVLGLEAADLLDRLGERQPRPREQQLTLEQRAIEGPRR